MNRKQFYKEYQQARFLSSANAEYATKGKIKDTGGTLIWVAIDSLHESIVYAMHNRYANTYYPIANNRWAINNNTKF
tara:strand:+ start:41 stop:271 length:231 start_codon:yes stop_codon:yes gene_type:complete